MFAFLSVLVGHKFYGYFNHLAGADQPVFVRAFAKVFLPSINGGGAGVVVFFLVSGYVTMLVLQHERPVAFLIRRAFRIYPLYVLALFAFTATEFWRTGTRPATLDLLTQALLIGDFFGTPYALTGIEWTLRIECLFYVLMAGLHALRLIGERRRLLPLVLLVLTLTLGVVAPIPSHHLWAKGYVTLYAPFLFLGTMTFLLEKKDIRLRVYLGFLALVFVQYYVLLAMYQPAWLRVHFAPLAYFLFGGCWVLRSYFTAPNAVVVLSDMTFAVYLFHNWAFEHASTLTSQAVSNRLVTEISAVLMVFALSYTAMRLVEKPGIRLGRKVQARLLGTKPAPTQLSNARAS